MHPFLPTVVIGAGLIGSAAAAYLKAALPEEEVLLIGPPEPEAGSQATVYASHYDAARIQRLIGKDATWTRLNLESAGAYAELEAETGIRFHRPVGCLYVSPHGVDEYLAQAEENGALFGLEAQRLGDAALAGTGYRFPAGSVGMLEAAPAGMIEPRALVAAQQARFRARGGSLLPQVVLRRERLGLAHRLHLADGCTLDAGRVLVTAGSFANLHPLLPQPLDITLKGESVVLGEVDEAEAARLAHLPALLYECWFPEIDGIYLTPPLRYPDGRLYVKMGANVPEDRYFTTLAEVQAWFRNEEEPGVLERLRGALQTLLPETRFRSFTLKHCLIHRTPSLRQYIGGGGEPGLYVVAGCNGYSAMCSDALGWLAAHLALFGALPDGYEEAVFLPQSADPTR